VLVKLLSAKDQVGVLQSQTDRFEDDRPIKLERGSFFYQKKKEQKIRFRNAWSRLAATCPQAHQRPLGTFDVLKILYVSSNFVM